MAQLQGPLKRDRATKAKLKTQINKADRRSSIILLSAKGKRMSLDVRKCLSKLTDNYKSLMGKTKYEQLVELLDIMWVLHE